MGMRLLSIDVGIRNLALCILEVSNTGPRIKEWKVIDLLPEPRCKVCSTNPALLVLGEKRLCRECARQDRSLVIPTPSLLKACKQPFDWPLLRKRGLVAQDCKECAATVKAAVRTKLLKLRKKRAAREAPLQEVAEKVSQILTRTGMGGTFDYVAIENQIGPQAIRMKAMQAMITQQVITVGLVENWDRVVYVSAKDKLSDSPASKKKDYEGRKKLGIAICTAILEDDGEEERWYSVLVAHPKKDDLADAYLQGIMVLKAKGFSPPRKWDDVMARIT